MNPGPAPRPPQPDNRPRLNLTPAIDNIPGNMSALTLNSGINSAGSASTTSLSTINSKPDPPGGAFSVLKEGSAKVKEEGIMKFWSEKWLVLRDSQLDFHKSSNSPRVTLSIVLKDVTGVSRSESAPLAFEISRMINPGAGREETNVKRIICKVDTDDEVYSWIDRIYERCPSMGGVSNPTNFSHQVHVGFDPSTGAFIGLPPEWEKLLSSSALSKEDYQKNPAAVIEALNFYSENMMKKSDDGTGFPNKISPAPLNDPLRQQSYGSSGATVTPPRPKQPNGGLLRHDSYESTNLSTRTQSPIETRTPMNGSPLSPQSDRERMLQDVKAEQDRKRREEEARRQRVLREQQDRERQSEQDRIRREREEQAAYNASIPKSRPPMAKQEIAGYGGEERRDPDPRWNPSRPPPQPPSSRDRQQPSGSLRQTGGGQRPPPSTPSSSTSRDQTTPPKSYANNQQPRPQSPSARSHQNGQGAAATRIPVKPSQDQNGQRRAEQGATSAPKPLNVTVKQPTGPAAVADAANKLEAGPAPTKDAKKESRMSSMTEAEVMTRLREVVSKEAPLSSYNKQKKIGQGASGSVYVARIRENPPSPYAQDIIQKSGSRAQVAIKQMDLRNQPRKELIVNEIVVMKDSKHPNIVNFIEAFLPEEQMELWVVMEFMEGGPLTDVIDNNPSIQEDQIATISLEVSQHKQRR